MHLFKEYKKRQNSVDSELTETLMKGQRPVFGYNHMDFADRECKTQEEFEQHSSNNWNWISNSILKSNLGQSEVQKIMTEHYKKEDMKTSFWLNMAKGAIHHRKVSELTEDNTNDLRTHTSSFENT